MKTNKISKYYLLILKGERLKYSIAIIPRIVYNINTTHNFCILSIQFNSINEYFK